MRVLAADGQVVVEQAQSGVKLDRLPGLGAGELPEPAAVLAQPVRSAPFTAPREYARPSCWSKCCFVVVRVQGPGWASHSATIRAGRPRDVMPGGRPMRLPGAAQPPVKLRAVLAVRPRPDGVQIERHSISPR